MNKYVVIVLKEVGKEPEFKKIENSIETFESIVGGEINTVSYDSCLIVFRKNQNNLKPNIYLNTNLLGFDKTLRGTVFAINKDKELDEFSSLNKEQAFKYRKLFVDEAYDYSNFDENGNFIINKKKRNKNKNKYHQSNNVYISNENKNKDKKTEETINFKKSILEDLNLNSTEKENSNADSNIDNFDKDTTLKLVLSIQSMIIKWIKENYY